MRYCSRGNGSYVSYDMFDIIYQDMPEYREFRRIVIVPEKLIIINTAADPDANLIKLIQDDPDEYVKW